MTSFLSRDLARRPSSGATARMGGHGSSSCSTQRVEPCRPHAVQGRSQRGDVRPAVASSWAASESSSASCPGRATSCTDRGSPSTPGATGTAIAAIPPGSRRRGRGRTACWPPCSPPNRGLPRRRPGEGTVPTSGSAAHRRHGGRRTPPRSAAIARDPAGAGTRHAAPHAPLPQRLRRRLRSRDPAGMHAQARQRRLRRHGHPHRAWRGEVGELRSPGHDGQHQGAVRASDARSGCSSTRSAFRRAASVRTMWNAPIAGSRSAMRERAASTASRAVSEPRRTSAAIAVAVPVMPETVRCGDLWER